VDDEDEFFEEVIEAPSHQLHAPALVAHALAFAANVCSAGRVFFEGLADEVSSHANYRIGRDMFAAEAGREIDKILETGE
jgi:hypothetical protein